MPKPGRSKVWLIVGLLFWVLGSNGDYVSAESSVSDEEVTRTASPTGESLSKVPKDISNVIRAEIISVNEKKQEVTFKDIATGNHMTTRVSDPSTLGSFSVGDKVRVSFASPDTSTATSVVAEENSPN